MVINDLEIEIKKNDKGYSFSSEENGKKRIYTIYSPELRQKVREVISPYGMLGKGNIQYEGKNSYGDSIIYQQGKDNLPDQLTLTSREVMEEKKEADEWDKIDAEFKEIEDELKKNEAEWKKREVELCMPVDYTEKHSWCSWKNDGSIGIERMYIKSENQSQFVLLENKTNSPQQIEEEINNNKEDEQETGENFSNSNEKDQNSERKINDYNNTSSNNKGNGMKKVFVAGGSLLVVGVGLYFLLKPKRVKN